MGFNYDYDRHTIGDIPVIGAEIHGDLPALAMLGGESLSYRELEAFTRRTAALLMDRGIRKGDRVAILSENRPEWGVASLAIARAGAVSVPILTDFTEEQARNILTHSEAKAAFVSERLRRKVAGLPGLSLLPIEALSAPLADRGLEWDAAGFEPPRVEPGDLAAIVYTSGTTGLSKGVMLSHRNYIADALSCSVVIVLDEKDVLLSILPLAHSYEYTIGFLIPLMSGSSIHYLDRPPSASVLLPALAKLRPTIMLSVPLVIEKIYRSGVKPGLEKIKLYRFKAFRPLLERAAGRKLMRSMGGRMRFFGIGGAPLDPETERFLLRARFPYAIGYGLTETAPIIAASAVGTTRLGAAGPALPGAEIRLASPRPAAEDPSLLVGELEVRGPMVGAGYFRDPGRTAEAFTADGFFKTGDLGYRDAEGRFHLRGRSKALILGPSGENIYPEEIEAVINSSPFVLESLVYGDAQGLTALVCLKPEALVEQAGQAIAQLLERVRKEANERLAAFSRIQAVRVQPEPFEKTPTQKIKRFLYPRRESS